MWRKEWGVGSEGGGGRENGGGKEAYETSMHENKKNTFEFSSLESLLSSSNRDKSINKKK